MTLRKSLLATSILAATLGLTACGGSSNKTTTPDTTTPTNAAPTNITLTASEAGVKENVSVAQEVGTLAATDADSTSFTFTTADERFTIEGTKLSVKEGTVFDFETAATVEVEVTVNDGEKDFTKKLEISIVDEMDYDFRNESSGESSVAYSGQVARHVLLKELSNYIKGDFATDIANSEDKISLYYDISSDDYENVWGSRELTLSAFDGAVQTTLTEISGSHKNLKGKLAGNDAKGQYKDWNAENALHGWSGIEAAQNTPTGFTEHLFTLLRENALEVQAGKAVTTHGLEVGKVYVTPEGVDLQQLIEKFLNGAVLFSQSADDYLDNDGGKTTKGLLSDNLEFGDKAYTALEHQWDEGYGYFGAARNYLSYSDDELASKVKDDESNGRLAFNGKNDTNADGKIDLLAEYNWGNSTNAGKRDRTDVTDLSTQAFTAFYNGRKLLSDNAGTALTAEQMTELEGYATEARLVWEQAIVATSIHYINDVLNNDDGDIDDIASGDYTHEQFYAFAKHWSEMKGFALNMQFNPVSPFVNVDRDANTGSVTEQFTKLHQFMANAPVIEGADAVNAYKDGLIEARNILRDAYEWKDKDGNVLTGDALEALVAGW
ncbi:DUF4856 domain-containing protein [Pseudoalteromonas sp. MTN2-4]|uniref:DUF4856 domain-containing protein n=1 Tax=Pseudoalteromonas sp. MTN2-4 TaxID=3056555 RepID=UPI0036F3F7FE